jgi:biopolymer transport protein ExbB
MNSLLSRLCPSPRLLLGAALLAVLALGFPAEVMAQDAPAEASHDNIFIHIIKSVGFFWIILLPISIALVAVVVLLALDLRTSAAIPLGFVDEFTDTVNKRKFKEAYDMARNDPSFLGRVMTSGMARLQYGLEDAREAAGNTLEGIKSDKEQKNNYTAVVATLGPLLGLVGTVFGMIEAFMELSSGANPNPAKLANGISHALAVTLVGVAISVPGIAFNTFFRNRITQVMLDVGHTADDLLTQMYHNSKKPGGPPMPTPGAPGAMPAGAPPMAAGAPPQPVGR